MFWNRSEGGWILFEIAACVIKTDGRRWRRACALKNRGTKIHFKMCVEGNWRIFFNISFSNACFDRFLFNVYNEIYFFSSLLMWESKNKILKKKEFLIRISERFPLNKLNIYHHCVSLCAKHNFTLRDCWDLEEKKLGKSENSAVAFKMYIKIHLPWK